MSIISSNFIKRRYVSPVIDEYEQKISYDEDGREVITYSKVDFHKILVSNGYVRDWSLQNLLTAGIDPKFGIHTGKPTRLDGVDDLDEYTKRINEIFSTEDTDNTENTEQ